jgi:hypothetical protein
LVEVSLQIYHKLEHHYWTDVESFSFRMEGSH